MLHEIPIRSERRRLDLQGVSVEPVAKVLLDGDSVLVDIGTMASRHTRRIAGLLSFSLRCEPSDPPRLADSSPSIRHADDEGPGISTLHQPITQSAHDAASRSPAT